MRLTSIPRLSVIASTLALAVALLPVATLILCPFPHLPDRL